MADIVDYQFSDPILLKEALEVAGACNQPGGVTGDREGNKKLALLGDAVIRLLILDRWYEESSSPIRKWHEQMAYQRW
jgi:ribonuclease-3